MKSSVDLESLVARELRRAIAVDGRSLNAVGKAAGFSKGYLSQLLRGRQDLKLQHLVRVLAVLEVHPSQFLRRVLDVLRDASPDVVRDQPGCSQPERDSVVAAIAPEAKGDETLDQRWIEEGVRLLQAGLREAVREVVRQELPRKVVAEIVTEYLGSFPIHDAEAVPAGAGFGEDRRTKKPELPIERIGRRLGLDDRQLKAEIRKAKGLVQELMQLEQDKRLAQVDQAGSRFEGALFGVLLLEEARRAVPDDPAESLSLAEVALASCRKDPEVEPDPEVEAPALAVRGNAKRALGRLREAEKDLLAAKRLLHDPRLGDRVFPAELDAYFGSLRKDQRKLEDAVRHLRRAGTLFGLLEQPEKAARVLLKLGAVQYRAGAYDAAVAASEEALGLLQEGSEAPLRAYVHYNRAYFLHAAGKADDAERELAAHAALLVGAGETVDFRLVWLRARIAWSRRELDEAGARFEETLGRARERGIPYDTGLLCLELALVRLAEGRTGEVKALAAEAFRVFAEEEVEPEVRTALALIEEAARRDTFTAEMLEGTVGALERAQAG